MNPGKRRISREMAVQMLYQSDLGGSPIPQIFRSYDLSEYMTREELGEKREGGTPEEVRAEHARRRKWVDEAFTFAQELVQGTLDNQEKIDDLIRSYLHG